MFLRHALRPHSRLLGYCVIWVNIIRAGRTLAIRSLVMLFEIIGESLNKPDNLGVCSVEIVGNHRASSFEMHVEFSIYAIRSQE